MTKTIQRVAMIGVGSIGGYVAPRLMQALGRENFCIIADGARRQRIERDGFTINGQRVDFPVVSSDESCEPADLVLIAVKYGALDAAIAQIANQVGPDTVIMSLLNGVDSEGKLAARYGEEHVLPAFMRIAAAMVDYSCDYDDKAGIIFFGEKDNTMLSERVQAIQALLEKARIPYKTPEDMIHTQWIKFMTNVSENQIAAIIGVGYAAFQRSENVRALLRLAVDEVIAVANAQGIPLGEADVEMQHTWFAGNDPAKKPSTLQDIEAGRPTEVEMFAGQVIRMGQELGIPTPTNQFLYHTIKTLEQKNAGLFD